ncbi:MAG: hypothetical protein ABSH20_29635 [Tepidisphaeraceae bacterium]|jgi:hypothetical protein
MSANCYHEACGSCGSCGTITHWVIDWDDGNTETISGNPSEAAHTFAAVGTFSISATACGDDDTSETVGAVTAIADNGTLNVSIDTSNSGVAGVSYSLPISAYFCSSYGTPSSQTNIDHWQIDWGDGGSPEAISGNPSSAGHMYGAGGRYSISATATTVGGVSATASGTATIADQGVLNVSVDASNPAFVNVEFPLSMSAYFCSSYGTQSDQTDIDHWQIDWGDGGSPETISGNPSGAGHVYTTSGAYSISATATTVGGLSATATGTATVSEQGTLYASIDASAPAFAQEDFSLSMAASFTSAPGLPSDLSGIDHWVVDWGDGGSPETISGNPWSATHAYAYAGQYTIAATASTVGGVTATATGMADVQTWNLIADKNAVTVTKPNQGTVDSDPVTITGATDNGTRVAFSQPQVIVYDENNNVIQSITANVFYVNNGADTYVVPE